MVMSALTDSRTALGGWTHVEPCASNIIWQGGLCSVGGQLFNVRKTRCDVCALAPTGLANSELDPVDSICIVETLHLVHKSPG